MKNIDKVIAQAREWAQLACTLAEIDGADLSTLESAHSTLLRAADALWKARAHLETKAPVSRWEQEGNNFTAYRAPLRSEATECAEGAHRAVRGFLHLLSMSADEAESQSQTPTPCPVDLQRGWFLGTADGLAVVLILKGCTTASNAEKNILLAEACVGAVELFNRLTSEEGVAEQ